MIRSLMIHAQTTPTPPSPTGQIRRFGRILLSIATTAVIALGTAACGNGLSAVGISSGGTDSGRYPIHIQFANVLNLPSGAEVLVDGTSVGRLESLRIDDAGFVVADASIDDGVQLDAETTATLQQSAPLADVHISLTSDDSSGRPPLRAGDTIPLSRTSQAPQIEDTLAKLAASVGQGTFTDLMTTVRQLNKAFPDDEKTTAHIFDSLGTNLDDLAAHQDSLDSVLDGMTATIKTVTDNSAVIGPLLTAEGAQHTTDAMSSTLSIVFMMTNLGMIAPPAQWVAPLVQAMDNVTKAVVPVMFSGNPLDTSQPSNLRRVVDLLHDKVIPFASSGPKVNITDVSVRGPNSAAATVPKTADTEQIMTVLRMIGLIR